MTTTILREALDLHEASADPAAQLIRGVVLLKAGLSVNRRLYPEAVLREAVTAFEGVRAYANHAPRGAKDDRSIRDLTGWYANVRYENGALRADRHFTRTQAGQDAWAIAEDIVSGRAPSGLAGLSISAVGTGKTQRLDDGEALVVEAITAADSVDDVSSPAAGGAYVLTASTGDPLGAAYLQALTYEEWFASRPDFLKRLQNELKAVRQDVTVKAALAEADRLRAERDDARAEARRWQAEREAALHESQGKARALAVEQALRTAGLPPVFEDDARARLLNTDPTDWPGLLAAETAKVRRGGGSRVNVAGAGRQEGLRESRPARRGFDMGRVETPADLQRELARWTDDINKDEA